MQTSSLLMGEGWFLKRNEKWLTESVLQKLIETGAEVKLLTS